jgi:hypothetical protein
MSVLLNMEVLPRKKGQKNVRNGLPLETGTSKEAAYVFWQKPFCII